jgi:hypothetical protein
MNSSRRSNVSTAAQQRRKDFENEAKIFFVNVMENLAWSQGCEKLHSGISLKGKRIIEDSHMILRIRESDKEGREGPVQAAH